MTPGPSERRRPEAGRSSADGEQLRGPIQGDARMIDEICRLRAAVWGETGLVADGAFGGDGWRDEFEEVGRHWILVRGDELVAAGRLTVHDRLEEVPEAEVYLEAGLRLEGRIAAPGRLVVRSSAVGRGLSTPLWYAMERAAIEAGAAYGVVQASPEMYPPLSRRGWREFGTARRDPRFPDVTFRVMALRYPAAPTAPGQGFD